MGPAQSVFPNTLELGGDLTINRLGLGTIRLTVERGFGPARRDARELLQEAVKLGITFFDTANSYGPGHAEEVICGALSPYRGLVIATKGGYEHLAEPIWHPNGHPAHLRHALEGSLRRLGLDTIDLYQLYTPDPKIPYEDSLGAIKRFQEEGKIRYAGISRVSMRQFRLARDILGDCLASVQNHYSIFHHLGYVPPDERNTEAILAECERANLALIAWEPLATGFPEAWELPFLKELAGKYQIGPQAVMLAALLQRSPAIVPIPGTSSVGHLRANVAALDVAIEQRDLERLWKECFSVPA